MLFETSRLIIRQFELTDASAVLPFYGDEHTMRFFTYGRPWATDEQTAAQCLDRTRAYYRRRPGYGIFAIDLKDGGEIAGHVLLKPLAPDEIEVGWLVERGHRGRGLATEAGRGMLEYGFDTLGLDAIVAVMFPDNIGSRRVAERLGMAYQGTRPERGYTVAWYRLERTAFTKQKVESRQQSPGAGGLGAEIST